MRVHITLDQARAIDALAQHGTLVAAANALHKGHTAVLYALKQLELQTDLPLLDRRGYRLALTPAGERVLEGCRRMLAAERALVATCEELRTGWEPSLRVVFDGLLPSVPILRVLGELRAAQAPTRVRMSAEFLGGVEAAFERDEAHLMLAVLPPHSAALVSHALAPLRALLVAHRDHPLARARGELSAADLEEHVLVNVRGGDPRLALSTDALDQRSTVVLDDFLAKREAILAGIGFGWLPEHLCARELRGRELRVLRFTHGSEHIFSPRLYQRRGIALGRAAERMVRALLPRAASARTPSSRARRAKR